MPRKINVKFEQENKQDPLIQFQFQFQFSISVSISPLVYRNIFRDDYYPSGYFPRTGTMADRFSADEHHRVTRSI